MDAVVVVLQKEKGERRTDVRLLHPSSTCVRVKNHYPESSQTCLFENSES